MSYRTKAQTQIDLTQLARQMASQARARATEREALRRNPMVPRENRAAVLQQFDQETAAHRAPLAERGRQVVAAFRDENVLKAPPDYRPSSAAQASWIAAMAAQAPHFTPAVMSRTLRDAAAAKDTAMVAALLPLAESYTEYKKEFLNSPVIGAIAEAREALRTPEVVASEEAVEWAEVAEREFKTLDAILGKPDPVGLLDDCLRTGSFPNLLPHEAGSHEGHEGA